MTKANKNIIDNVKEETLLIFKGDELIETYKGGYVRDNLLRHYIFNQKQVKEVQANGYQYYSFGLKRFDIKQEETHYVYFVDKNK